MYATSAKLLDTTLCFFNFQEINKLPCLTKNSKTDFLVLGQEDRHKKVLMNWRLDVICSFDDLTNLGTL